MGHSISFKVIRGFFEVFKRGFFISVLAFLVGCGRVQAPVSRPAFKKGPILFTNSKWHAKLIPTEEPVPLNRATTFKLYFWFEGRGNEISGPYEDPALTPQVWLWMRMPSGPHGSAPIKVLPSLDVSGNPVPGVYDLNNVVFTMAGEWDIHIRLKNVDGTIADEFIHIVEV